MIGFFLCLMLGCARGAVCDVSTESECASLRNCVWRNDDTTIATTTTTPTDSPTTIALPVSFTLPRTDSLISELLTLRDDKTTTMAATAATTTVATAATTTVATTTTNTTILTTVGSSSTNRENATSTQKPNKTTTNYMIEQATVSNGMRRRQVASCVCSKLNECDDAVLATSVTTVTNGSNRVSTAGSASLSPLIIPFAVSGGGLLFLIAAIIVFVCVSKKRKNQSTRGDTQLRSVATENYGQLPQQSPYAVGDIESFGSQNVVQ